MAIGESVKAPLYALGADGDYHKVYIENVAEQVVGLGRRPNTTYAAGDVVSCSTNNQLNLVCTTAGTTANTDLDISSNNVGDTITDGTVVWSCFSRMQAGVPVGFEYFSTNPNIPAGSIPLFGGEYSRTTYADLWSWVQEQAGYLLEESDWQAKASANDGNVPYYSNGDGSTTFRVPSLKCWVKGANGIEEVGSYLQAGLPNVTGGLNETIQPLLYSYLENQEDGAFYTKHLDYSVTFTMGATVSHALKFDASRSNPIYGNSDTVQPKSIVGMWLVKAYGTVSNVGSTDVADIAHGLTELETRQGDYVNKTLASDKELVVGWGMPDYTSPISIPVATNYTAPNNGWIYLEMYGSTNGANATIDGVKVAYGQSNTGTIFFTTIIPIRKGSIFYCSKGISFDGKKICCFYPCKGVNN